MSYFGCDICFAKAVRHVEREQGDNEEQRDRRKKQKGATMVYPAGIRAELRTHARHLQLAKREGPESDAHPDVEFYGVKEGVPFLSEILPDFDLVRDICIDWMHNVCEGSLSISSLIPNHLFDG